MSVLSIHPIEYFKLHFHMNFEVIGKRLLVLLVTVSIFFVCILQLREAARVTASFNNAITEMVVPPLRSLPMGM